jgi:hypothetical protein
LDPRADGTIYIWMLGAHRTAYSVPRDFGHEEVFELLMERTPEDLRLALACELGDETVFPEFLAKHPHTAETLSEADQRKLPNAAQNNNTKAVRLMLEAGWPVVARLDRKCLGARSGRLLQQLIRSVISERNTGMVCYAAQQSPCVDLHEHSSY